MLPQNLKNSYIITPIYHSIYLSLHLFTYLSVTISTVYWYSIATDLGASIGLVLHNKATYSKLVNLSNSDISPTFGVKWLNHYLSSIFVQT